MDKLTLNSYLRKVEASDSTKDKYRKRFAEVEKKIISRWYQIQSTDRICVHVKIPSEKTNLMYDVLIEFPFNISSGSYRDFRNSEIKVFSNCPSFVFMNARVFERKHFLLSWAKDLYNKDTLAPPPEDKKEEELNKDVVYEKSLYFAALHLDKLNPVEMLTLLTDATKMPNPDSIIKYIRNTDWAMERRGQLYKREREKKDFKKKVQSITNGGIKSVSKIQHTKGIGRSNKVGKKTKSKKIKYI